MNSIRVLLADDHPVYRDGLRLMLESGEGIEVVAEASHGREAVKLAAQTKPDVALLDINMPDMSGTDVAKAIRDSKLGCAIMFVTMEKSNAILQQAIDIGVDGYLHKNSGAEEIIEAVQTVARGEKHYSPAIAELMMGMIQANRSMTQDTEGIGSLTPAERKVLRLVASDRTSKEIATELGVSVRTIDSHRSRITRKLGLSGAHSLVKFAFEHRDEL